MNRRIDPLSQEERELAERLGRLGGPREPAPALDAAILAAARAAVAEDEATVVVPAVAAAADPHPDPASPNVTPLRPRRTVPRWPIGLSVAATVVLAAGIGWKLQGDGDGSSADKAMAPAAAPAAEEAVLLDPSLDRAPVQPPPPPPPELQKDDASPPRRAEADAFGRRATTNAAAPAEQDAGFVADADLARQTPAPAASLPAASPSREQAVDVNRESKGIDLSGSRVPHTTIGQSDDRAVGAAEYTRAPLEQRREQARTGRLAEPAAAPAAPPPVPEQEVMSARDRARKANGAGVGLLGGASTAAGAVAADKPAPAERYDERPPVTADSPEFRQSWLQRIRALLAGGDTTAAAESLQEFRRRYPSAELPEDLRKFAATLPPPAP